MANYIFIFHQHENKYGVDYVGLKRKNSPERNELLCALKNVEVRALRDGDEPWTSEGVSKYFPHLGLLEGTYFNSCVVVSSAGSLKGSKLGKFIGIEIKFCILDIYTNILQIVY